MYMSCTTKLCNGLIVTALDPRLPSWCILAFQWWNVFMSRAQKQRWSFDIQHIRNSLEHVGNHGSANHAHAVPNAIRANIDSRTHKKEKTTHAHIAQGSARRKKEHGGGKNDRRHDSCVSNFSRDVHRTTYSPFWGTHGHADLKPLDSTCQRLAQPNAAALT